MLWVFKLVGHGIGLSMLFSRGEGVMGASIAWVLQVGLTMGVLAS